MLPESMFIGREKEINLLNKIYNQGKAELILLYGRRRIGKTRLLKEFIKDKNSFYFIGDMSADILQTFEQVIKERFVKFQNWDDFFDFLTIEGKKRTVVILDEFQYLYKVEKAWPTILQRRWEDLKNTKIMIILCGSIVSSIYKIAMGYGSALYGRKTYEIELSPLSFFDSKNFMKQYTMDDFVYIYSITGGIPRYLEEMDDTISIWENIQENIANKNCFLYREPLNIFYEEFKNPSVYLSIIHSLSEGGKKFNEISTIANISMGKLTKYLNVLERVKIIKKIVPVTENKERTRNTQYVLMDNYIKFWFKFIYPHRAFIELDETDLLISKLKKELHSFVGYSFEEICSQFLFHNKTFQLTNIGTWWQNEEEIDLVGLNDDKKEIYFFECKWKDLSYTQSLKIFDELKNKSKYVKWFKNKRKAYFGLFAKKIEKKDALKNQGFLVYDLQDWKN